MTGCAPSLAQALLPYPAVLLATAGLNENHGKSIYHSLQAKLEKRFSGGTYAARVLHLRQAHHERHRQHPARRRHVERGQRRDLALRGGPQPLPGLGRRRPTFLSAALVYELPVGKGKKYLDKGGVTNAAAGRLAAQHGLPLLHGHPVLLPVELLQRPRPVPGGLHPGPQGGGQPVPAGHGQLRPRPRDRSSTRTRSSPWTAFNFYYGNGTARHRASAAASYATRT